MYEQVEYKAEAVGVSVKQVGSAYTSKRCAECGFTADENRPTRNDFRCQKCASEANADYNAAKNIGMRYVRRGQQSSRRTGNAETDDRTEPDVSVYADAFLLIDE